MASLASPVQAQVTPSAISGESLGTVVNIMRLNLRAAQQQLAGVGADFQVQTLSNQLSALQSKLNGALASTGFSSGSFAQINSLMKSVVGLSQRARVLASNQKTPMNDKLAQYDKPTALSDDVGSADGNVHSAAQAIALADLAKSLVDKGLLPKDASAGFVNAASNATPEVQLALTTGTVTPQLIASAPAVFANFNAPSAAALSDAVNSVALPDHSLVPVLSSLPSSVDTGVNATQVADLSAQPVFADPNLKLFADPALNALMSQAVPGTKLEDFGSTLASTDNSDAPPESAAADIPGARAPASESAPEYVDSPASASSSDAAPAGGQHVAGNPIAPSLTVPTLFNSSANAAGTNSGSAPQTPTAAGGNPASPAQPAANARALNQVLPQSVASAAQTPNQEANFWRAQKLNSAPGSAAYDNAAKYENQALNQPSTNALLPMVDRNSPKLSDDGSLSSSPDSDHGSGLSSPITSVLGGIIRRSVSAPDQSPGYAPLLSQAERKSRHDRGCVDHKFWSADGNYYRCDPVVGTALFISGPLDACKKMTPSEYFNKWVTFVDRGAKEDTAAILQTFGDLQNQGTLMYEYAKRNPKMNLARIADPKASAAYIQARYFDNGKTTACDRLDELEVDKNTLDRYSCDEVRQIAAGHLQDDPLTEDKFEGADVTVGELKFDTTPAAAMLCHGTGEAGSMLYSFEKDLRDLAIQCGSPVAYVMADPQNRARIFPADIPQIERRHDALDRIVAESIQMRKSTLLNPRHLPDASTLAIGDEVKKDLSRLFGVGAEQRIRKLGCNEINQIYGGIVQTMSSWPFVARPPSPGSDQLKPDERAAPDSGLSPGVLPHSEEVNWKIFTH